MSKRLSNDHPSKHPMFWSVLAVSMVILLHGCSLRQMAVDRVGDAIASGGSAYERDEDIVLVGDALPFSLKLLDSLIDQSPRHRGLLLAASRGYLLYAYGYVGAEAERVSPSDLDQAAGYRLRARNLYLRAFSYSVRGLDAAYPGLGQDLSLNPEVAVRKVGEADRALDVALLHAAAANLALAIASDKQDVTMLARLPEVDALLGRALELDEAWNDGALHELAMSWLSSKPGLRQENGIEHHYSRALELSGGRRASIYLGYAEAVKLPAQDRAGFVASANQALAVNLEDSPDLRLVNALAQKRARWLLGRLDELFLE